jgi:hypothetical protein
MNNAFTDLLKWHFGPFLNMEHEKSIVNESGFPMKLRGRPDMFQSRFYGVYDLKTCRTLEDFERSVKYDEVIKWQAAVYTTLLELEHKMLNGDIPTFEFYPIAVEKESPNRAQMFCLDRALYQWHRNAIIPKMNEMKKCFETNCFESKKYKEVKTIYA